MIPKFRAWDKDNKKMIKVKSIHFMEDKDDFSIVINPLEFITSEHVVLMQATGLQDKNGVDIYDGDILEVISQHDTKYISLVRYMIYNDYPAFDIVPPDSYFYESNVLSTIVSNDEETMEIIGNIYENSEFLEGKL